MTTLNRPQYDFMLGLLERKSMMCGHYAGEIERHAAYLGDKPKYPFETRAEDELNRAETALTEALVRVRQAKATFAKAPMLQAAE